MNLSQGEFLVALAYFVPPAMDHVSLYVQEYLDSNIVELIFFVHHTPGHIDLRDPLQEAQNMLVQQGIHPAINSFWSFVPRRIQGGGLSNHALGRAIDINPGNNPHIRNRDDIRVILAITNIDLGQPQTADDMRQASISFQQTFNQQWIDQQNTRLQQILNLGPPTIEEHREIQQLRELIRSINGRRQTLNGYARRGFFNLEQSLIDALTGSGFRWGGQYQHSKDFMHFEIP
jgi:D-alanyl-D-alanine carboxypeptidase-like protein